MTEKPVKPMHLKARFDIDQDGESLDWHFIRSDGNQEPSKGKDTGAIYFTRGEKLKISLTAVSEHAFDGFEILNCALVSRPQVYSCGPHQKTVYGPPSPFVTGTPPVSLNAVVEIPGSEFIVRPDVSEATKFVMDWNGFLQTGTTLARWELSFIVTVGIRRSGQPDELRVFSFDPETVVGSGSNPPD